MAYEAGSVVVLKSGEQPMTVVSASDDEIECVWIGDEGVYFRHTIPAIALVAVETEDLEDDEEELATEDDAAEEEDSEDERAA